MSFDPAKTDVCAEIIAPGLWRDGNGHFHYALPEILAHCGIPDIPEEREENLALLQRALRESGLLPEGAIVITRPVKP